MKTVPLLYLSVCLVAIAPSPLLADPAPAARDELGRLELRLTRLEGLLNEQKQLLQKVLEADHQRQETLQKLIRSLQASGAKEIPAPPAEATTEATPPPVASPPAGPVTIAGRVSWTQGPQEAYVYLEGRGAIQSRAAEIRQEGKQFDPPVVVVPVGSRVTFPNADIVFHNVFSRSPAAVFDLGTIKGGQTAPPLTLSRPGHIEIFCNIHSNMRADILVVPNDHYTKVRPDGTFNLAAVPPGSRKLVIRGPRLKPSSQLVDVRPGVSVSFNAEPSTPPVHLNKRGRAYGSYDE